MNISEALKQALQKKRMSIRELSEITGIPKSAIQRYTSGDTDKIPSDRLMKIVNALGVGPGIPFFFFDDENETMTTGERIKERRKRMGLSAETLADRVGVSPSTMCRYENGDISKIDADILDRIASELQTTSAYLLGRNVFSVQRMDALRAENGLSDDDLESALGMRTGYLRLLRRPGASPSTSVLTQMADVLGCSVDYLMSRADSPQPEALPANMRPISSLHHQSLPLIGDVAAGEPIYAPEELGVYVDSPVDADAALTVRGDSMAPTYLDGDIVYIKCRPDVPEGAIAVVFLDDEATIKHIYYRRPTGLTLTSDNPGYPPMMVEFDDYTSVRIFGVPVGYTRIFKKGIDGKIKKWL